MEEDIDSTCLEYKIPSNIVEITVENNCLSYNSFFRDYLLPNVPCLIKSVTNEWKSTKEWIINNKPNYNYLKQTYGNCKVTVYRCYEKYFNSQKTQQTTFDKYCNYWECKSESSEILYLKDWHLANQFSNDKFYQVPIYFSSDWLNEYFTECLTDDYRFVYMGPKNSWTPFHADVFNSYSWSANVCGQKRWLLFPPGEENYLRDDLNNLPYDILTSNYKNRRYFEVTQNAGDVIFVPSGWYHQVWNLDDTISINHNWINGCNVENMFDSMMATLKDVQKEIEDCKEMDGFEQQCQVILKSTFGMDFKQMFQFLQYIATKRLNSKNVKRNHVVFDLNAIKTVLNKMINCDIVNKLEFFQNNVHNNLLELINNK